MVGPTNGFGEVWVLANDGAGAGVRTARQGIVIGPADFNPERIQLDDDIVLDSTPDANVGDHFTSDPVGVLDYNFGNYEILLTSALTRVDGGLVREATRTQLPNELAVASFNVENLSPVDPPAKFARLAGLIVGNLRSPDVVAVQEIQDNDGPANSGVTDATLTFQQLIAAIQAAGRAGVPVPSDRSGRRRRTAGSRAATSASDFSSAPTAASSSSIARAGRPRRRTP